MDSNGAPHAPRPRALVAVLGVCAALLAACGAVPVSAPAESCTICFAGR